MTTEQTGPVYRVERVKPDLPKPEERFRFSIVAIDGDREVDRLCTDAAELVPSLVRHYIDSAYSVVVTQR